MVLSYVHYEYALLSFINKEVTSAYIREEYGRLEEI